MSNRPHFFENIQLFELLNEFFSSHKIEIFTDRKFITKNLRLLQDTSMKPQDLTDLFAEIQNKLNIRLPETAKCNIHTIADLEALVKKITNRGFSQDKLAALVKKPDTKCDGCECRCEFSAAKAYGHLHPVIGGKTITTYYDAEGRKQIIFSGTCPTKYDAINLAREISKLCDKYQKQH